jgi:hypothetical protein
MPKRSRRVPRYLSEDPARRQAESRRQFGIPRDAIPADPEQQVPQGCPCPPRFYSDYTYMCEDCGREQVWTAEQQRWWYEVAKCPLYSRAVRCQDCREARDTAMRGTPRKTHFERRLDEDA